MKRTLALTTVAVAALVLSGCGGNPTAQPTATVTVTHTITPEPTATPTPTPEPTATETPTPTPTETVPPAPAPEEVPDVTLVIPDCPRLNAAADLWSNNSGIDVLSGIDDADMFEKNMGPSATTALQGARTIQGCTYYKGADGDTNRESFSELVVELSPEATSTFHNALRASDYDRANYGDGVWYSDGDETYLLVGNAWILLSDDNHEDFIEGAYDGVVNNNPDLVQ